MSTQGVTADRHTRGSCQLKEGTLTRVTPAYLWGWTTARTETQQGRQLSEETEEKSGDRGEWSRMRVETQENGVTGEWSHRRMETEGNGDGGEWRHRRVETQENGDTGEWRHRRVETEGNGDGGEMEGTKPLGLNLPGQCSPGQYLP